MRQHVCDSFPSTTYTHCMTQILSIQFQVYCVCFGVQDTYRLETDRVFTCEIGLVKVIYMGHMRSPIFAFERNRSIWSNQHCNGSCTTSRTSWTFSINLKERVSKWIQNVSIRKSKCFKRSSKINMFQLIISLLLKLQIEE